MHSFRGKVQQIFLFVNLVVIKMFIKPSIQIQSATTTLWEYFV